MGMLSGRRAFRIIREVQMARVELVGEFPSEQMSTPGSNVA